jgi:ABC-type antimicrobial peptide transport system permease subunit
VVYRCSVALWIVGSALGIMAIILFPKAHFGDLNSSAQVTIIVSAFMLAVSALLIVVDIARKVKKKNIAKREGDSNGI